MHFGDARGQPALTKSIRLEHEETPGRLDFLNVKELLSTESLNHRVENLFKAAGVVWAKALPCRMRKRTIAWVTRSMLRLLIIPDSRRDSDFPASRTNSCEQRLCKVVFLESALGMPLHADDKSSVHVFDRFDDTIGRRRDSPEVGPDFRNRLVVKAVYFSGCCTGQTRQETVGVHLDQMTRRLLWFVVVVVKHRGQK